jgi:hypothetical protein
MKMTRVSGPINFLDMNSALDGIAALRDAGFNAELDHDAVDLESAAVFGAVWLDIEDPADADIDKVWDQVKAVLELHGGDCFEFGIGSELTVWRS